jgi:tRNA 2-selenouridine synthase
MNFPEKKLEISEFLHQASQYPVIDVRSPGEFRTGHIPGAVNIPLFDDEERAAVGTKYKNEGRLPAILHGLDLTGPKMTLKLIEALKIAERGKLLVHCWRGGMRSEAMAWLFSLGNIETAILAGGYKSYRNHILERLGDKRNMIILGGLTGSGKTEILRTMSLTGHQVVDLEGLACHKGSAFGSLGQPSQPTSEQFANLLYSEISATDPDRPLWLEDESKNIGTVFIADRFFTRMQESPVIALIMSVETRMPRLMKEYSTHSKEDLILAVQRISKRLGGDNTKESIASIESGDFTRAIEITLNYYDKTYLYGLKRRREENLRIIETNTDDLAYNIDRILQTAEKLSENK